MRKMLADLLTIDGLIDVIGTAKNGQEAIEKIETLTPDVITMDVEMPILNGIDALKEIMKSKPIPIIMLSSLTKAGADITIKALQLGAFDFVAKPSGSISFDIKNVKNELIDKILIAHHQKEKWAKQWNIYSKPIQHPSKEILIENCTSQGTDTNLLGIVAIGTSTGGPKALQEVLPNLPSNFPYALLIVQHMPAGFTKSLANRLNSLSEIEVMEAEDGQLIEKGKAYIAPGQYHMVINKRGDQYYIRLNQEPPVGRHRPSVDVMFASLKGIEMDTIAVVLTGMGNDGTKGLLDLKSKSNTIAIAEAEETCVVFGMPKSAIQSGMIDQIVPIQNISLKIIESVRKQRGWQSWK